LIDYPYAVNDSLLFPLLSALNSKSGTERLGFKTRIDLTRPNQYRTRVVNGKVYPDNNNPESREAKIAKNIARYARVRTGFFFPTA